MTWNAKIQKARSLFLLPANSTAIFQPLDQGVISILITQYKYQLLNKVIEVADHYDELQVLAKHVVQVERVSNMAVLHMC